MAGISCSITGHGLVFQPVSFLQYVLSRVCSYLAVAIAAVHGSITAGLKRYLGGFPTLGTGYGEHVASGGSVAVACSLCLAASGTALGLVLIASGLEEFLLVSAEGKACATISTLKGLVRETHRDDLLS